MKKLSLTVILLTCLFYIQCFGQANINCPFPGSVTCPPDTLTQVEFVPSYENLPCAIPGIPYSQVVQVHTPSSTTADGLSVDIETITIDTISNLPCGLCWSCAEANNTINGGATGCLLISGTTTDAPGQYLLTVLVKAAVKIDGIIPTTAYENLATLGLNYYVRVSANGTATCTAVDTTMAGNTTGAAGTIAAPGISGGTTICSGSSTTLGVAGGTYSGYLWSTGAVTDTLHVTSAGAYSVTVYENCNSATASVTVTSTSASASISTIGSTTFCQGGSVKLVASKGTSYAWNTSPAQTTDTITVTQSGSYVVTVTSGGCNGVSAPTVVTVKQPGSSSISASFCANASYNFNGKVLTTAGTYFDTLTAANGCDSIVTLTLTSKPISNTSISASFCANSSYNFNGKVLTSAGTYFDTLTAANGCDSIVTLTLTSKPISNTSISASFCANSSYNFNGKVLTTAGTYFDTLTAANGCDSIVTLTLTSKPISNTSISASFCANSSYNFNGKVLTSAGTYFDTLTAANGCDSIVTLTLTSKPISNTSISASFCANSSYNFNGKVLSTAGTYFDTLTAANGCDSIVTLTLTAKPISTTSISGSFCANSSYNFNGKVLSSAGTYFDTLTAANGCDSIITLTLTAKPISTTSISASFCANSSYNFNGKVLSSAGTYFDTLTAANGCDSIVTLTLTSKPISTTSISGSFCSNSSYNFNGKALTQAGTYKDTFTAANGCDSIVTLTLTSKPISTSSISASFCANSSYNFNGKVLSSAGTYFDTLTAANGCDSIVTLTLTSKPISTTSISGSFCSNSSYNFNGKALTQAGIYFDTLTAASGCDSIITLTLSIIPVTTSTINATICTGSSYVLNGKTFTANGTYFDTVSNAGGCDSIITLNLTVSSSVTATITALGATTFCSGGSVSLVASKGTSYAWNTAPVQTTDTITVTQSGSYVVTVTGGSCSGVSSPTVVTVNQPVSGSISASICSNSSYNFNGKIVTSAGTYKDTLTAANGCDSIVTLTLTTKPISTSSVSASICANSSYTFNGKAITSAGTYFDTLTAANGCDSIVALTLTTKPISTSSVSASICANSSYTFNGKAITSAGTYFDTLTAANGCDSIVTLTLTTKPISTSSVSASICAGSNYNFNGKELTTGGTYKDTLTSANGCDSIITLTLTVNSLPTPTIVADGPTTFCAGGSVVLDAGAGYSAYSWNTTPQVTTEKATITTAGNYSVTVTQNGCPGASTNTIAVSIDTTHPVAVCKNISVTLVNGSATITASQVDGGSTANCGIASRTVVPSSFTTTDTGNNTVVLTITDSSGHSSSCDATVMVSSGSTGSFKCDITSELPPSLQHTGSTNPDLIYLGYGPQLSALEVSTTGGAGPYHYSWSPTTDLSCDTCAIPIFKPTAGGSYTYSVTVTDGSGSSSTCGITFCVIDARSTIDYGLFKSVYVCHNPQGCNSSIGATTYAVPVELVPLILEVFPCDELGKCGSTCQAVASKTGDDSPREEDDASIPLLENIDGAMSMLAYPNPFSGAFHLAVVSAGTDRIDLRIYDIYGRLMAAQQGVDPNTEISLGNELANGIYIIEVTQGANRKAIRMTKAD